MQDWMIELRRGVERAGAAVLDDDARVRLERRVRGYLEARRLRHADAVVVSFGKSGRTWLRVMLSHFYKVRHGLDTEMLIEFDNMHRRDRGIPRLLFTHDNYLGDWTGNGATKADYFGRRVVLLARHPADTAVSQFHQWKFRMRPHKKLLNQYPPEDESVELFDFVMDERGGVPRIVEFMNRWAEALPHTPQHLLVRYEDLRVDTARELDRVLRFIGTPGDAKAVQDAVDYASFERMRARESEGAETAGAGSRLTAADRDNPDSFKTRRAKVGGYRDDFEPEQAAQIDAYVAAHLNPLFGYVEASTPRTPTDHADAPVGDAEGGQSQ
ncbi:MAG TPA: sulfotransferase domain-containing protein [Pseudomonadales bacterium]|nr:sulfotransferase domain-containing protein [Pseudomonadales bacterium]